MRLGDATTGAAMALPLMRQDLAMRSQFRCRDGYLTAGDVARAAGVSAKAARRAVDAYCAAHDDARSDSEGATLAIEDGYPDPQTQTRKQMAEYVARRVGIGRFGIAKRIAERAAAKPEKKKGKRMSATSHPWSIGRHGRSVGSDAGGGVLATLTCSRCPKSASIRFRKLADAHEMDRKFEQRGWAVDPSRCPDHNRRNHQPKKDPPMASADSTTFSAPSPAAIAAQAKMFGLLQTHFDPDTGVYSGGYSDQKIAEECRLAVDLVVGVRKQAFGELKVPSEVAQLNSDIEALEALLNETVAPIQAELRSLKERVRECCRKFGG